MDRIRSKLVSFGLDKHTSLSKQRHSLTTELVHYEYVMFLWYRPQIHFINVVLTNSQVKVNVAKITKITGLVGGEFFVTKHSLDGDWCFRQLADMSATTLSLTTLSIKDLLVTLSIWTLSIKTICMYCRHDECGILFIVVLNGIMTNGIMWVLLGWVSSSRRYVIFNKAHRRNGKAPSFCSTYFICQIWSRRSVVLPTCRFAEMGRGGGVRYPPSPSVSVPCIRYPFWYLMKRQVADMTYHPLKGGSKLIYLQMHTA